MPMKPPFTHQPTQPLTPVPTNPGALVEVALDNEKKLCFMPWGNYTSYTMMSYECFQKEGYPKMDGFIWKTGKPYKNG